jgi:GTP-binding protein
LIEGAHEGTGLGISFLKHIERTGILVHMIDAFQIDPASPLESFNLINNELSKYSQTLTKKTQIVVLNKIDLPDTQEKIEAFKHALKNVQVLTLSAATGKGVKELVKLLASKLIKS